MKIRKQLQFDIEVDDTSLGQCSILCDDCARDGITGFFCDRFRVTLVNDGDDDEESGCPLRIFRCLPCIKAETVSGAA